MSITLYGVIVGILLTLDNWRIPLLPRRYPPRGHRRPYRRPNRRQDRRTGHVYQPWAWINGLPLINSDRISPHRAIRH